MDARYIAAMARSYAGQVSSFSHPVGNDIVEFPLGFQPLGISSRGSLVAVAAYFEPAVMLAHVTVTDGQIHFKDIEWIRSTLDGDRRVRMFPNLLESVGANRMQVCLIYSWDHLGLIRNEERRIFHIRREDEAWVHENAEDLASENKQMIHSAHLSDDSKMITTIESDNALDRWMVCSYLNGKLFHARSAPPFRYGIERQGENLLTVSDPRAPDHGLFVGDRRVVDLTGNGMAQVHGAGLLLTQYGQAQPGPFNGVPGALVYVPPNLLV